jgi:tryptophan synthase alpha chain
MNRIDRTFSDLKAGRRKALIAYMTAGFPTAAKADAAFRDLERGGADVIEIGVPFSDPIADGPTIQFASQKALETGLSLRDILAWVSRLRRRSQTPVVLMSYMNPILRLGFGPFAKAAAKAGVDGLIVPDSIPEETDGLRRALETEGLDLIHLVAPTTPPARRRMVASRSRGFLYAVSLTGVTGARKSVPAGALRFLDAARKDSPVPVAVGFGISGPDQVRALRKHADGVIVGSAIINHLKEGRPLLPFVKSLRAALDRK